MLDAVTNVLKALEEGANGRQKFCEAVATIFVCEAVGHVSLDVERHGWSLCLWRHAGKGPRSLTLANIDLNMTGDVRGAWWSTSGCRRVALEWVGGPHRAELPFTPGVSSRSSVLMLGRGSAFGPEDVHLMNMSLMHIAAIERTMLRLEPPVFPVSDRVVAMTEREVEVLRFLRDGLMARSIAHRMAVSERTVHKHLENLYHKLGVHDRVSAVIQGQQLGVLSDQPTTKLPLLVSAAASYQHGSRAVPT